MGTREDLGAAFAGESQANRKYLFFAEKADQEGHPQVARLFRAAAEAETVHARNHLGASDGVKSTKENLTAAIAGEHYEFTQMYPGFIKQAETELKDTARTSFDLANKVEKIHHGLFKSAMAAVEQNKGMADKPFFVCQRCGNTVEGQAPDRCPVCGAPRTMFKHID